MGPLLFRLFAQGSAVIDCGQIPNETGCDGNTGLPNVSASTTNVQLIFQIVFGIIGAAAVIIIIVSAINLAAAQGDPHALAKARQAIIFASIGLAVALSAEVIVSLLISKV